MSAVVVQFPPRRRFAIFLIRDADGWLAIAGAHGWRFGSREEARSEARWLSRNLGGLPIREVVA